MATQLTIKNQTQQEYQDSYENGARAIAHIYAKSNESLNLLFRYKKGNGLSIDLTGYTAAFCIRERKDGHIVAATCDTTGNADGTITLGWDGTIRIQMPYTKLQSMYKTGEWKWDLVIQSPEGIATRLIQGNFYIDRSVTYLDDLGPTVD